MISWAITACNEHEELKRLLNQIESIKKENDEIVIQLDSNYTEEVKKVLNEGHYSFITFNLNKDFASFKNNIKDHCTENNTILYLDADEQLSDSLLLNIHELISLNPTIDCLGLPRINTVRNIETRPDLIQQWGWQISKIDNYFEEKILDLNNPNDKITYDFLKENNLIVKEDIISI